MSESTISTTITSDVTLGYGPYLSLLSITSTGKIDAPGYYAITIFDAANATVTNSGTVSGRTDGVYLHASSASIVNNALLEGGLAAIDLQNFTAGDAFVSNDGTLKGERGITGQSGNVANSGSIYGSIDGIHLQLSTIANSGVITGQAGVYSAGGTLTNHGSILGSEAGISIAGGEAVNFGSISGSAGTGAAVYDLVSGSATLAGTLINAGRISGGDYGVTAGNASFTNAGSISGRIGLRVGIGGAASNAGVIYGTAYGAELFGQANQAGGAALNNSGSIAGGDIGVTLGLRGSFGNSGYVTGQTYGVAIYGGYLTNSGQILDAGIGVTLSSGVVNNLHAGTIDGLAAGLSQSGGLVDNYGTISGVTFGAFVTGGSLANFRDITGGTYGVTDAGGNVTNYGVIASPDYGVKVSRATVTNAGTISGSLDAIEGSFITLAVQPGAVFIGDVVNDSGKSLLVLGGAGLGTLGGIGSQITGFKEISFATGPQWSIEGNQAGLAMGETIVGFAPADTIVLDGFSASSDIYVKNTGLELSNGGTTITLDITGNFSTAGFGVTASGNQTTIADVTCFVEGTRIATPDGEIAVEALNIGDLVTTRHHGARTVKWIGSRSYDGRFIRGNKAALPVRIKAGAIADGIPARDLRVSPGHAISIDDVLVHARRLVNGVSVVQEETVVEVTYFHIELENHEILLAENCPAESFMDEHFRQQFQNAAEFARLYPGQAAPRVMCQPRLDSGFLLYKIQRRLRARAGLRENRQTGALRGYVDQAGPKTCFGWAQDEAAGDVPVCLDILAGGRRIGRVLANLYRQDVAAAGYGDGYQGFEFQLPAGIVGPIEVRRARDGTLLEMASGALPEMRAA